MALVAGAWGRLWAQRELERAHERLPVLAPAEQAPAQEAVGARLELVPGAAEAQERPRPALRLD